VNPREGLDEAACVLLGHAAHVYRHSHRAAETLRRHLDRLSDPLRLAVVGAPQAGKSLLVSALIGEELAPVELDGRRRLFIRYQDGLQPRARINPTWGSAYELPLTRCDHGLRLSSRRQWDAPGGEVSRGEPDAVPARIVGREVHEVVVDWPTRTLRRAHLIDTPALSLLDGGGHLAERVLSEADALLYLTRHLGAADLSFLRRTRQGTVAAAAPVHVVTVLSRADETSGGQVGALSTAKQLARRRRREPRVAALCQDVLALSPLIAYAARSLRDEEFAALRELADAPRDELDRRLLSADRFTCADYPTVVSAPVRGALLDRLGLGGVRLATTLIRTGCHSRTALAERLLRHSGLAELQASIAELFTSRPALLKARSALVALERVLRTETLPQSAHLLAELERLVVAAHEFRELRLLAALRSRRVTLPVELAAEAGRLVGGEGCGVPERLGLAAETPAAELWSQAHAAVARWRAQAQRPDLATAQRRAVDVVVHSCEAMQAGLG
jgi:hypothetical protein